MAHDLIVVGGGLMGLFAAWEARRAGLRVLLLERARCGRQASSASAGGVRSLGRALPEIALARAGLEAWAGLSARLGGDVGFARSGQLRVAEDAAALAALEARAAQTAALGWRHERMLDAAGVAARVPAIAGHVLGALAVDDDGFADPLATLHALTRAARTAGVEICEGVQVQTIARADAAGLVVATTGGELRARAVVNCAGAWAGVMAEAVPMRAAGLQMIVTAPVAPFVTPVLGSQGRKLSLKQTARGAVVIGGAFEGVVAPCGRTARPLPQRMAASLGNAARLFPHLEGAPVLRAWAGIEGMVADGLPVLGPSAQVPGLVQGFGFSAHGFALAPVVGRILSDLVTTGRAAHDIAAFAPGRFARAPMEKEFAHAVP